MNRYRLNEKSKSKPLMVGDSVKFRRGIDTYGVSPMLNGLYSNVYGYFGKIEIDGGDYFEISSPHLRKDCNMMIPKEFLMRYHE